MFTTIPVIKIGTYSPIYPYNFKTLIVGIELYIYMT